MNKSLSIQSTLTSKQKEILLLLHKFRFLSTTQLQKIINHKDPHRIKEWLKELTNKKYIKRKYEKKSFEDNTKPAVYFLAPKSRQLLKFEKNLDFKMLEYIYSEHRRQKKFIEHCLFIADVYFYLYSQKEESEDLKFFTKIDLVGYEYFPQPLPDTFISVMGQGTTRRYFLDLFDESTPPFVMRRRVKNYFDYVEKSNWDENTDNTDFPSILLICPNESIQKHIYLYEQSLLEKTYEDKVSLFLTTKSQITIGLQNNIWQKVE